MTERIQEKNGAFVPPANSHFSYVLIITFSQPTIRIKIPKVLVKAMQKTNQARTENDENGVRKTMKKYLATSKESFRKRVGSMFSNIFGKKKGETGEVHSNGNDEDYQMKKLKNMIEGLDISNEDNANDEGEQMALATGFGLISVKEMLEAGDEGKEKPKPWRTYSETLVEENDQELNKGKINNVDDCIVGSSDFGDKGANAFGTKRIVSPKQAEHSNCHLPSFRWKTPTSSRKLKIARSMKKTTSVLMRRKSSGKQELCKKRILMGGKCRPLNQSGIIQYDENGVLMPEIIP